MFGKSIYMQVRDMGFWKKSLATVLVFSIFSIIIYYFPSPSERAYFLFLLFLPLIVTSGFYLKKWNFFPSIICTLSLLILSILHYGQQFFDVLHISLLNLSIFFILYSIISILIGHVNVSYEELREERNKEIIDRKETEDILKHYKAGVEASGDSIYMMDRNYRYVFANDEHLSRLVEDGRIPEKDEDLVVGRKYRDIHSEEDSKAFEKNLEKVIKTGEQITEEQKLSEVKRWSSKTYSPIKNSEPGEVERIIIVSKDITEKKEAEKREEFLHSLLRHDLRNKTQIVQGYLELLQDYDLPVEAEEYVRKAEKGIGDSMDLIEKVRTLRSIDREEEIKEVGIGSMIKNVINERQLQAQEKGMEIEFEEIDSKVLGESLLEELFSNLIENSIKHSGGDKIRVTSREKENECIITVEDDGQGISGEYKDKIFERGFKGEDTGGFGLGMYLVKQIIERYNGSIEVKDSELGGARFDIHLQKA